MTRLRLVGIFALAFIGWANTGWAQEAAEPLEETQAAQTQDYRDKAARGLFEAGSVAFEEGRYEEALDHFSKAYELSPNRHLLLYNIGSSFDRLRRDREALSNFEKYLQLNPTAQNRAAVEARVKVLRDAVEREDKSAAERKQQNDEAQKRAADDQANRDAAQVQSEAALSSGADHGSQGLSPLYTYVGVGVTAALGGLTLWSSLNAKDWQETYDAYKGDKVSQEKYEESKNAYDKGTSANQRTVILLGATATVGVATAVIAAFFTDWSGGSSDDVQATAWVRQDGAGMELQHAF